MSKAVLIQPSFYDAMKILPDNERLLLFDSICEYSLYGKEPDKLPPVANSMFLLMKPNIDSSAKRYVASVTNGRTGGAPKGNQNARKQPKNNQTEQPKNNQDYDYDSDLDSDLDLDSSADKPPAPTPAREPRKSFGAFGWIKLTDAQYKKLLDDLGEAELERCIAYIDEAAQATGNKNRWRDWNVVIRKCSRQKWGVIAESQNTKSGGGYEHGVDKLARLYQEEFGG